MAIGLAGIVLLSSGRAAAARSRIDFHRYDAARFRLIVAADKFSGDRECRLWSRDADINYVDDALGFRMRGISSRSDIWFRVDSGVPKRWRDALPMLANMRVPTDDRQLTSPVSTIWIPAALVLGARTVAIETGFGKKVRMFDLDGFSKLRTVARQDGCVLRARLSL